MLPAYLLYRVWSRLTGTARPASLLVKRPSAHDIDAMGNWILLVWATGIASSAKILWMMAAFSVLSVATDLQFAPVIIAELAPDSLRGVYLAISYQCWSIGYFIGPILGGWAIDQRSRTIPGLLRRSALFAGW